MHNSHKRSRNASGLDASSFVEDVDDVRRQLEVATSRFVMVRVEVEMKTPTHRHQTVSYDTHPNLFQVFAWCPYTVRVVTAGHHEYYTERAATGAPALRLFETGKVKATAIASDYQRKHQRQNRRLAVRVELVTRDRPDAPLQVFEVEHPSPPGAGDPPRVDLTQGDKPSARYDVKPLYFNDQPPDVDGQERRLPAEHRLWRGESWRNACEEDALRREDAAAGVPALLRPPRSGSLAVRMASHRGLAPLTEQERVLRGLAPLTEQERVLRGLAPLTLFAYGGPTAHFDPFAAGGAPPYTYYAVYVNQGRDARRAARLRLLLRLVQQSKTTQASA